MQANDFETILLTIIGIIISNIFVTTGMLFGAGSGKMIRNISSGATKLLTYIILISLVILYLIYSGIIQIDFDRFIIPIIYGFIAGLILQLIINLLFKKKEDEFEQRIQEDIT